MKTILFYTNGIYRGGIEIALYNLISHLDTNTYKIYVTCTDKDTFEVLEKRIGNYCEYVEIDEEINVDILIFCNYVSKFAEKYIKNIKCKKSYFWFHCFGENQENFLEKVCKENLVDKIITVCDSIRKELLDIDYLKGQDNKIITIKNILDSEKIKMQSQETVDVSKAKDLTMIVIARLVKEKGLGRVKILLNDMKQQNIDYKLLVIGTANTEEQVTEIKNMFKDDEKVIFLGYQENPYKYLTICDYNVLLSDRENMSLSMMEAKILGVPNIVTDFESAFEEVTDMENGFILSRENTASYKERISQILNEKQRLKNNLKDFKYDITPILYQWEELMNEKEKGEQNER